MSGAQTSVRRLRLDGEEVEVADDGDGEAVLLVHGGVVSDWFVPVAADPELSGLRRIRIRRAGDLPGVQPTRPLSLADQARHRALLLDALGVPSAHVCGHSAGAPTAIQLTVDSPDRVPSRVLLETAPAGDLATSLA